MKLSKINYFITGLLIINIGLSLTMLMKETYYIVDFVLSIIILIAYAIYQIKLRNHSNNLEIKNGPNQNTLQYESLFQYNLDIIFTLDTQGYFTNINPAGEKVFGYPKHEILQTHIQSIVVEEDKEKLLTYFEMSLLGEPQTFELKVNAKHCKTLELYISAVPIKNGNILGIIGIAKDITAIKKTERKLVENEQRYRSLFQYNPDAILSYDLEGNFVELNPICSVISGYNNEELSKMNFIDLITEGKIAETLSNFEKVKNGLPQTFETSIYHKNGKVVFIKSTNIPIWVDDKIVGVYGIVKNITDQKLAESHIEYMAYHDPLTSLPNRTLFKRKINEALDRAKNKGIPFGIMFLDLDRFKLINDTLGHNTGDLLIIEVAKRFKNCIRAEDIISRRGGDEFTILLQNITQPEAEKLAYRIIQSLNQPFKIENNELFITTSIGISLYPIHGKTAEDLLLNADMAMYKAKEQGKNNFQMYSPILEQESHDKLTIQNQLYKALEKQEFILYYQPQIDIQSNNIVGVEALIRWHHPNGIISPQKFISLSEETGLILPIGEWILRKACLQAKKWQEQGFSPITISVNLSTRQFYQPNLVSMVSNIIKETNLSPQYLELELTESMTMNMEIAPTILNELKKIGIKISIDDFGTGYSSLYYLKRLPIDCLKIDQTFTQDIGVDHSGSNIVSTIIDLAHHLNLKVIAEGVETEEQLQFLKEHHCNAAQGYLISPPIPAQGTCQYPQYIETYFTK